ncbi:Mitochondrial import receptor subunit TOM7 [Blastocladiella emersonii ATCC 22665]|nr:Mitochondrial import receptor subunit TOM7 [Blastocladiella emersonii ATCC 22665]
MFSEENKERIVRLTELVKKVVHVGYIPFILYIGLTRSNPRPSLLRLIHPFA